MFLQDTAEKNESFLILSFLRSNGQTKLSLQPCPFSDLLTPFISLTTSLRGQAIKFYKGYHTLLYIPLCKKKEWMSIENINNSSNFVFSKKKFAVFFQSYCKIYHWINLICVSMNVSMNVLLWNDIKYIFMSNRVT